MRTLRSPVHPNAVVVALVGLVTAVVLGVRHSMWAGVGFGAAALAFVVIVNQILARRQRQQ